MKCLISFTVSIALAVCCCVNGDEIVESLNAITLISSQLEFLETMCFNRMTAFEDLQETVRECQQLILNGTPLTYNTLTTKDPLEFYQFYTS